jgi:hypothetical protein
MVPACVMAKEISTLPAERTVTFSSACHYIADWCPFTGLSVTRRWSVVVELLVQVEHACGSCPMSLG